MADVTAAAAAAVQGDRAHGARKAKRGLWRAMAALWSPLDRAWTVYALFLIVFLVRSPLLAQSFPDPLVCGWTVYALVLIVSLVALFDEPTDLIDGCSLVFDRLTAPNSK